MRAACVSTKTCWGGGRAALCACQAGGGGGWGKKYIGVWEEKLTPYSVIRSPGFW